MAVFTPVSQDQLASWLLNFDLGTLVELRGIPSGIENTNYFVTTAQGQFVLTLFEKLTHAQLPFYLNLMRHLSESGLLVPAPMPQRDGNILCTLNGKPATLVTRLRGSSEMQPGPQHCAPVGRALAQMHLAGQSYPGNQPNLRGLEWWIETAPVVTPFLPAETAALLNDEVRMQAEFARSASYGTLPAGPVHADLFRDNVLFTVERMSGEDYVELGGFIDFYFAGCDTWLFDLAVCINDWCIDDNSGVIVPDLARAMLDAYAAERPFTADEVHAWPMLLRAAALRFWLSRLYDFYLPRPAEMVTPKDPTHFERILRDRRQTVFPLEHST
ncbi:MAG: homoserine kinase [Burkholderiaceae bacterium]|nr:MAG: homoserine kinase [Burkholderiaceae bacterium]